MKEVEKKWEERLKVVERSLVRRLGEVERRWEGKWNEGEKRRAEEEWMQSGEKQG